MATLKKIRARATYANVTATLALFVALGGGSFAVAALSGSEKKVVKKIAKKQADKRITARAPGLTVEHAGSADAATPTGAAGGDLTGTYPNPLLGPDTVGSAEISGGAVGRSEIADQAITSAKFFRSAVISTNVAPVAGGTCTSAFSAPLAGITSNQSVVVTPPPAFPATFTLTGVPDPGNNEVEFRICNHFPTGSADPDGVSGDIYKVLVIEFV